MTRYALLDKSGKTRLTTEAGTFTGAKRQFIGTRKGAPIPAEWSIVKREVKAATKPTTKPTAKPTTKPSPKPAKPKAPKFKPGDRVRLLPGHGYADLGDYGVVLDCPLRDRRGDYRVQPEGKAYEEGLGFFACELELAPKKEAPEKLAPGHVEMKMDSGDTLEFWLGMGQDGALDLRGRAPGGGPSFYVASVLPSGILLRYGYVGLPGLKLNAEGEVMM